jgi:hypothetical protein
MTCIGTIPRLAALALSIFILSMTTGYAYVRNHRNGVVIPNGGHERLWGSSRFLHLA